MLHREERRQYVREKEREEEQQAERERLRKIEAARKRRELRKRKLDEHTAMAAMRDQAIPIARRKPTKDRDIDTAPLPSSTLKGEPSPSSANASSPPQLSSVRETSTGYSIGPLNSEKCPYCVKESFNNPVEAVAHIVNHGGSILDVQLSFYFDNQFLATETQLTGEKCNACEVNFDFPTQNVNDFSLVLASSVLCQSILIHPLCCKYCNGLYMQKIKGLIDVELRIELLTTERNCGQVEDFDIWAFSCIVDVSSH
ncbi:unnamed protein product [Angiostrongylus costaricensis]|uniref:C2H2-type domain-containing protein n=1 Tax=Angiostrongylus costaricensis TaxID=334426 RepID=A0A0R3PNA4_ANGCS|nr:unnamed protein product [Angiostrongylus costaricensis]